MEQSKEFPAITQLEGYHQRFPNDPHIDAISILQEFQTLLSQRNMAVEFFQAYKAHKTSDRQSGESFEDWQERYEALAKKLRAAFVKANNQITGASNGQ